MADDKRLSVDLITQKRVVMSREAISVVLPSGRGTIGILPGHAPLIGTLTTGIVRLLDEDTAAND